jgi:hypothetical protein
MSNDELHTILYEQVYQYARATTPVSNPAIYYAHIVVATASVSVHPAIYYAHIVQLAAFDRLSRHSAGRLFTAGRLVLHLCVESAVTFFALFRCCSACAAT